MWKKGTFYLEDIDETLLNEIVFFDISYPRMGDCGCVIFFTRSGDEYIISQQGIQWQINDIVKFFPNLLEAYQNKESGTKDVYGFTTISGWKMIPELGGEFYIRMDYFEKFNSIYQTESELNKKIPCTIARTLFGKKRYPTDERMVYIKTQESWDADEKERMEIKRDIEKNRLLDNEVPWIKYKSYVSEGYIKFLVRKNSNGTLSGYRWLIHAQKEKQEEGVQKIDAPIECYNLFLQRFENMDEKVFDKLEDICNTYYVIYNKPGEFVRSYKTLEKAMEAVSIRNEWVGWGNVNKKNVYMIDYDHIRTQIESASEIYIFY